MCRLFAVSSNEPLSPIKALEALDVMKEGHDGSGVGLLLRDLGGTFENMKDAPILSGIFTDEGLRRLDTEMMEIGFRTKYKISFRLNETPPEGVPKRDVYLIRAYEYPKEWDEFSQEERERGLTELRIKFRLMGLEKQDMIVFSFWPDVIMIKEIGDPMQIGKYLKLDQEDISARIIMAQGRQNTNYAINLYACHPFFLQGYSTMTNGENTAFIPIKEFLESRNYPGYMGFQSDSEVFTHILHFIMKELNLGVEYYKHIITPLGSDAIDDHPDSDLLKSLKKSCRKMIIDGPNCVIGSLPDNTMFMAQDRKKLRPGIVGGRPGIYAFSSEACGLDYLLPDRDKTKDFQPMYLDTAIVGADRQEVKICRQTEKLPLRP